MRIPLADPRGDMAGVRDRIVAAVTQVIDSGSYILGSEVARLEATLGQRLGTPGVVSVGSGTDALILAMMAVGVAAGDEVITVSHTAGATAAAVRSLGAVPVFVDIAEDSYCMDPAAIEAAITLRTRAILPVHLYGHPADLAAIMVIADRHDIPVVEDCAQAQEATIDGRPVGSIGAAGCFSFYPTKMLGALGDGGMVVSTRDDVMDRARLLRTYGWRRPQFSELAGGRCSRLDEMQAAILRIKLDVLATDVERRREIAGRYQAGLSDLLLTLPVERPGCRHVYHLYVVRTDRRDALAEFLDGHGIGNGIHYRYPIHKQPGLASGSRTSGKLGVTEQVAGEILSLPIYPSLSNENQDRVIAAVRRFF